MAKRIVIIGGGLAGLITAIQLSRAGMTCTVFEKNEYPFHRVCGEYISNEALPFLKSNGLLPEISLPQITRLGLSSTNGREAKLKLDLGGFGISRYCFDNHLYQIAKSNGVEFFLNAQVDEVSFQKDSFILMVNGKDHEADFIVGAFGKRSKLDVQMNRSFIKKRSPYLGIKYHIKTDFPDDLIALHNFQGGYCGVSRVENSITNLCYLANRNDFRKYADISEYEHDVLFKNPLLKYIFINSEFILEKPLVINEISFESKNPVERHILMVGDASGMIAPLCGNGMAMAIHGAKILSDVLTEFYKKPFSTRKKLEVDYGNAWRHQFASRIWRGRQLQKLFGSQALSNLAVNLALYFKPVSSALVRSSHGKPF